MVTFFTHLIISKKKGGGVFSYITTAELLNQKIIVIKYYYLIIQMFSNVLLANETKKCFSHRGSNPWLLTVFSCQFFFVFHDLDISGLDRPVTVDWPSVVFVSGFFVI